MTLATERAKSVHTPTCNVYLDGFLLSTPILSCTVDLGYDSVSAAAEVHFAANIATQQFANRRQQLRVDLGWGGFVATVFTGVVDTRERVAGQFTNTLRATGRMALAMLNYQSDVSYSNTTGKAICADLLTRAGILATNQSLDDEPGGAITFGTVAPVVHKTGSAPVQTIDRIDNCFGMRTYDTRPGTVVRRRSTGLPTATARVTRSKSGPDFFSLKRHETIADIRNKVIVVGMPQTDGSTLAEGAVADNPLVPNPPRYLPLIVTEDILQTPAECQTSANLLIQDTNPMRETVEYTVVGDPLAQPGDTEGLTWDQLGWASQTNYRVRHVHHQVDASGYLTVIQADGYTNSPGSIPAPTAVTPNAAFTVDSVIKRSDHFEINCTDQSTDPDGTIASISFSNNVNGTTSSVAAYQISVPLTTTTVTITDHVTDNDGLGANATAIIDLTALGGGPDGTPPIQDGTGGSGTPTSPLPPASPLVIVSDPTDVSGDQLMMDATLVTQTPSGSEIFFDNAWLYYDYSSGGFIQPVLACTPVPGSLPSGAQWISFDPSCSIVNGWMLCRVRFTLGAGIPTTGALIAAADDLTDIYVNGNWAGKADPGGVTIDILKWLNPGWNNCIAFKNVNSGAGTFCLAFRITVS